MPQVADTRYKESAVSYFLSGIFGLFFFGLSDGLVLKAPPVISPVMDSAL